MALKPRNMMVRARVEPLPGYSASELQASLTAVLRDGPPIVSPRAIFETGAQGVWIDPAAPGALFLDELGVEPADVDLAPVRLALDRAQRAGGVEWGRNLVANGGFEADLRGWSWIGMGGLEPELSVKRARIERVVADQCCEIYQGVPLTAGASYRLEFTLSSAPGHGAAVTLGAPNGAGDILSVVATGPGAHAADFTSAATQDAELRFAALEDATVVRIDDVRLREIRTAAQPGAHALAPSDAARPLYRTQGGVSWLAFYGVDDALSVTLPDLGSDATLAYATEAGSTILTGQTLGGPYDLPGAQLYGFAAFDRAPTAGEEALLTAWLDARRGAASARAPVPALGVETAVDLDAIFSEGVESVTFSEGAISAGVWSWTPAAPSGVVSMAVADTNVAATIQAEYAIAFPVAANAPLTVLDTGALDAGWVSIDAQPAGGLAAIDAGNLTFDPAGDFAALPAGAPSTVTFRALHGDGEIYTVAVTVTGVLVVSARINIAPTQSQVAGDLVGVLPPATAIDADAGALGVAAFETGPDGLWRSHAVDDGSGDHIARNGVADGYFLYAAAATGPGAITVRRIGDSVVAALTDAAGTLYSGAIDLAAQAASWGVAGWFRVAVNLSASRGEAKLIVENHAGAADRIVMTIDIAGWSPWAVGPFAIAGDDQTGIRQLSRENVVETRELGMTALLRSEPEGAVWFYSPADGGGARVHLADSLGEADLVTLMGELDVATPAIYPAATALSDLLPDSIAVGEALSPSAPESLGDNLFTAANDISATASVDYATTPGWVVVTQTDVNQNVVFDPALMGVAGGDVIELEVAAGSQAANTYVQVRVVSGAYVNAANLVTPEVERITLPADVDRIRLLTSGGAGTFVSTFRCRKVTGAVAGVDVDMADAFAGGDGALAYTTEGAPAGFAVSDGVISAASAADVGAGADYVLRVTARSPRGMELTLDHPLMVTEPFALLSNTIVNAADGGEVLRVGDTARMLVEWRGWPGPFPSGSGQWPQWRRGWGDQTGYVFDANWYGELKIVPEGATEMIAQARLQLDDSGASFTDWATAAPVTVTAGEPGLSAPVIFTQAQSSLDGRLVTISAGAATGNPDPSATLVGLTLDGVSVLGDQTGAGPWSYAVPGDGAATVGFTVSWSNGIAPDATSGGSISVPGVGDAAPAAPSDDDWRVSSAYDDAGEAVYLAVDRIPADATAIECERDGAWSPLDKVSPGVFTLAGFTTGASTPVRLRFVNAVGAGAASASKSVSAVASSDTAFAVWADDVVGRRHWLDLEPTAAGSAPARAEGVNQPFRVEGGGEAEIVRWATSAHAAATHPDGAAAYQPDLEWSANPDPGDSIFYQPLGSGDGLAPAQIGLRTIYTTNANGGQPVSIVLHGAGGMLPRRVNEVLGFGAGGLPVEFRFDRPMLGGVLPDGRPFVIGAPARIVHNGGDPIAITPDAVKGYALVSLDGAVLCVVQRAGIIPPLGASAADLAVAHGYSRAYVRRRGALSDADWESAAWDAWDNAAAASAPSTGLTLRPNFESVGIYAAGLAATSYSDRTGDAGTNVARVRFRKVGDAAFIPGHPLWYDDRSATIDGHTDPRGFMAARHRGVAIDLEPGAEYEFQIKQGATYLRATVSTLGHAVAKTSIQPPNAANGFSITKEGATYSVTGVGDIVVPDGEWLELRDFTIRGTATISATVERVIFRNVNRFGRSDAADGAASGENINGWDIADGANNLRFYGGASASWGRKKTRWCDRNSVEFRMSNRVGIHSVAIIGRVVGSPRHGSNGWQERSDYGDYHPFGASVMGRHRSQLGHLVFQGNVVDADGWRGFEDIALGLGGAAPDGNKPDIGRVADNSCDAVFAWNSLAGWLDDAIEFEGAAANMVHVANTYWCRELRPGVAVPAIASQSWIASGPMLSAHNLMVYTSGARGAGSVNAKAFKVQGRTKTTEAAWGASKSGRKWEYHSTVTFDGLRRARQAVSGSGTAIHGVHLRNALHVVDDDLQPHADGAQTNYVAPSYVLRSAGQSLAGVELDGAHLPTGAALVGQGEWIRGVNEGGPFFAPQPSIGARMAP